MRYLLPLAALVSLLGAQTPDLTPLEREFQESLTGVVLEGQSTRDGKPGVSDDRYAIDRVVKQSAGTWLFHVRVQYGGKDITIPFPIQIEWAGDTPVVTMTDQQLQGMGTYTARVLFYKGNYAGTWSGKNGGGKVFGRIVKQ